MEAKSPGGNLASSELHAIHTALLSCTDADHHSSFCIANRVGLGVLNRNGSKDGVNLRIVRQTIFLRNHFCEMFTSEDRIIALLHVSQATAHTILHLGWHKVSISFQNDELAT